MVRDYGSIADDDGTIYRLEGVNPVAQEPSPRADAAEGV
jgi:hypothetical protein